MVEELLTMPDVGALAAGPEDAPETVLYLHGWGGSKELWWNTLRLLGDDTRGIAVDLPGVGGSALPDYLRTMSDMAQWVLAICCLLSLPPVTLVGHSLGANLAAQFALDCPDRVRRLALVDAALDPAHLPPRGRWTLSPRYGLMALRLTRWSAWPLAAAGRYVPHEHRGGHWVPYARRSHYYLTANTDAAMQMQIRALYDNPHDPERLTELGVPILIVHGERDGIVPVSRARALADALPDASLSIFPTAHHCPMDADPPGFARTLREFISRSGH